MKETKKYFIKEASVLLLTTVLLFSSFVVVADTEIQSKYLNDISVVGGQESSSGSREIIFEDGFESYTDFGVDNFPPWTTVDNDGRPTYAIQDVTFPNQGYTGSGIIFNPYQTTPPIDSNHPPHTGQKYLAIFDAVPSPTNDDWIITPQLSADSYDELRFWARSLTDQYGLERMRVLISTTDNNPASFTPISTEPYVQVPITWTEYVYDLSSYSGDIYLAINCVSSDAFALFIDDYSVSGETGGQPVENYIMIQNTTANPGDVDHIIEVYGGWNEEIFVGFIRLYINPILYPTDIVITNVTSDGGVLTGVEQLTYTVTGQYYTYRMVDVIFVANTTQPWVPGTGIPAGSGKLFNIILDVNESAEEQTIEILESYNPSFFMNVSGWAISPEFIDGTFEIIIPNSAPEIPAQPTGPTSGYVGQEYQYLSSTTDPDEDDIYYMFDWGNGEYSEWLGPYASGDDVTADYIWNDAGVYHVKAKAKDVNDFESDWSVARKVTITENQAPDTPYAPSGPDDGEIDIEYDFSANTNDPEEHDIYYLFDWDDGTDSGWLGPYPSGDTAEASHTWTEAGTYDVTVKAKDIYEEESDFSPAHQIIISEPGSIEIGEISGGMGILAQIINTGTVEVNDIVWTISISGGFIILTPEENGTIASIATGEEDYAAMSAFGFGLGIIKDVPLITVTATLDDVTIEKSVEARIIGPLVFL